MFRLADVVFLAMVVPVSFSCDNSTQAVSQSSARVSTFNRRSLQVKNSHILQGL
jgi:hypothetical protein